MKKSSDRPDMAQFHKLLIAGGLLLIMFGTGCVSIGNGAGRMQITDDERFIDSMGRDISTADGYETVVSLYSAHTENAYIIGAGHKVIGVNSASTFPPEATDLPVLDYRGDPEPLIALKPDAVLTRPNTDMNYSDYIKAIEKAGIQVISLYPDNEEDFDTYIEILGMVFGTEEQASDALEDYHSRLDAISQVSGQVDEQEKLTVFFESTKAGYRTVTTDSNPARAITLAGGINLADDVKPVTKGSTIAEYGIEKLMVNSDRIDVYVSQRGGMNGGGSLISIPQREGFSAIKAVQDGNILEINQKLISAPSLRYDKGVMQLARTLYPWLWDALSEYDISEPISRETYAELMVKVTGTPFFVPTSTLYYEKEHKVHTYGMFDDVRWWDEDFDYIETAVINSFIRGSRDADGTEHFDRMSPVTRADVAFTLFMLLELETTERSVEIGDLEGCGDPAMVQKLVDAGIMDLDEMGNFNPDLPVTGQEVLKWMALLEEDSLWAD